MAGRSRIEDMNVDELVKHFRDVKRKLPRLAAGTATRFFKENFRRRGFPMNGRLEKWPERQRPDYRKGGALLIKTGKLRRSIRPFEATPDRVVVGSDDPKAAGHNEGLEVQRVVQVPGHRRKGFRRKVGNRRQRVRASRVKAHTRQMNVKLPQRRFIGNSPDLMKSVERDLMRLLTNAERKL